MASHQKGPCLHLSCGLQDSCIFRVSLLQGVKNEGDRVAGVVTVPFCQSRPLLLGLAASALHASLDKFGGLGSLRPMASRSSHSLVGRKKTAGSEATEYGRELKTRSSSAIC